MDREEPCVKLGHSTLNSGPQTMHAALATDAKSRRNRFKRYTVPEKLVAVNTL
jgi:hypothetical protein